MIRWLALALLTISNAAPAQFLFPPPPKPETTNPDSPTLYGDVDESTAARVIAAIHTANKADTDKPIHLYLQSLGGSVMAGNAVISAMTESRRPVHTIVVGQCASMCAMVAEHGKVRAILPQGWYMFHNASASLSGDLPHIAGQLAMIQRIWAANEQYVSKRIGMDVTTFRMHEALQWWLTASEAVDAHLADVVINPADYPVPKE